ncbi:hypothetical protein [Abyssicoccus albus]|uniref:Uncharacterized protein n=1 Tax=Abyssicoccus albus TaxID=1817405 RepID=A0A3N5C8H5_9BACL|nr:hypothetical protein [Abyssicoccus albus]RPF54765.1 hypothetical protein EDD62_1726 [Abyssicoccus albus]
MNKSVKEIKILINSIVTFFVVIIALLATTFAGAFLLNVVTAVIPSTEEVGVLKWFAIIWITAFIYNLLSNVMARSIKISREILDEEH